MGTTVSGMRQSRLASSLNRGISSLGSRMGTALSINFDELGNEDIKNLLSKKVQQVENNFETKLKNLKPIVYKEAVNFVDEKSTEIIQALSKQHRHVVY